MIKAVIFDMDGLLVDSEPWWRVAETEVFGKLSVTPSEKDFEAMMGNRIQEVIAKWFEKHPWKNHSHEEVQQMILEKVEKLVRENAELLPGVRECISGFRQKKIPVALASSSPLQLIRNLMQHYRLLSQFDVVRSAEKEPFGKPDPAVFLATANDLKLPPPNCLVFEDSYNGLLAAKAATMKCVVVPAKHSYNDERFDAADAKLSSLEEFSEVHWETLNRN